MKQQQFNTIFGAAHPARGQQPRGAALLILIAAAALAASPASLEALTLPCLDPTSLVVDASPTGNSDGNGVLEPGETVGVTPGWFIHRLGSLGYSNLYPCGPRDAVMLSESGFATTLAGPLVIEDSRANYMCPAPCSANGYSMSVAVPTGRPGTHWDATFHESVVANFRAHVSYTQYEDYKESAATDWSLHIGDSFTDVPRSQPFYKKIETLLHRGITLGCSPTEFCPGQVVSRGQLAVFVAKGLAKSAANIPASGTVGDQPYDCSEGGASLFSDVAPTDMFCKHIHYIASKNVDAGCDEGLYCPGDNLTRLQMAAFVAKALVQPGGDDAVPLTFGEDPAAPLSYSCDPASPNIHFTDVPATDPLCKDVNYLWARGVVSGCSPTEYCTTGEVTRDQMAKFVVNAFKLTLYGP